MLKGIFFGLERQNVQKHVFWIFVGFFMQAKLFFVVLFIYLVRTGYNTTKRQLFCWRISSFSFKNVVY